MPLRSGFAPASPDRPSGSYRSDHCIPVNGGAQQIEAAAPYELVPEVFVGTARQHDHAGTRRQPGKTGDGRTPTLLRQFAFVQDDWKRLLLLASDGRRSGVRDHQLPPRITEYHLEGIAARSFAHYRQYPRSSVDNGPVRHRAPSDGFAQRRDYCLKLVGDFRHGALLLSVLIVRTHLKRSRTVGPLSTGQLQHRTCRYRSEYH